MSNRAASLSVRNCSLRKDNSSNNQKSINYSLLPAVNRTEKFSYELADSRVAKLVCAYFINLIHYKFSEEDMEASNFNEVLRYEIKIKHRVAFNTHWPEIETLLSKGFSVHAVYRYLVGKKHIETSYQSFARHVRIKKAENIALTVTKHGETLALEHTQ